MQDVPEWDTSHLAHLIDKDGIRPSKEHLKAILEYPFIGMVGHFRRFIANFSRIARPLHLHLEVDASKLKAHKVKLFQNAKESFNLLKQALLMAPVLKFADYSKPFVVETDASSDGLGAVLLQADDEGKLHPIAYSSRSLTKAEHNYHSGKLELLCAKWAVMDQCKEYLLCQLFVVRTDNNPPHVHCY